MKHQNVEKWISGWSILMMLPGALWILTFFVGKIGNVDPFEHAGMRIDYIFETAVRIVLMIIGAYYYVTVDDYVQPYFSKDLFKKSSDVS
ncbi:MAG TPA: hypothetical protein PLG25_07885 [bacterium]|nr:hypothetical protein [bacterium]